MLKRSPGVSDTFKDEAIMRISCLHTSPGSPVLYDQGAAQGAVLTHIVRPDLSLDGDPDLDPLRMRRTTQLVNRLSAECDLVLITCPTIVATANPKVLRADRLLAKDLAEVMARDASQTAEVLCPSADHVDILTALFFAELGPRVDLSRLKISVLPTALDALLSAEAGGHSALVAQAIAGSDADIVVLTHGDSASPSIEARRIMTPQTSALEWLSALALAHSA